MNKKLYQALVAGNVDQVKNLIQKEGINSLERWNGKTALHLAVDHNHPELVSVLVQCGVPIDECNDNDQTALHHASQIGNPEMVRALLEHGSNCNKITSGDATPLHLAAFSGHEEVVALLLEQGGHPNQPCDIGYTPLHCAVSSKFESKKLAMVQKLKKHGASALCRTQKGQTVMHKAALYSTLAVLRALMEDEDLNPNLQDSQNWTPLHQAAYAGHLELVNYFLNHPRVIKNALTVKNETPLLLASKAGHTPVVEVLSQHNNPNLQDDEGQTPLFLAAKAGNLPMLATLLQHSNIDCNLATDGWTLLHVATYSPKVDVAVIQELLQHTALDPNATTSEGLTPLMMAIINDDLKKFTTLIKDPRVNPNLFIPFVPVAPQTYRPSAHVRPFPSRGPDNAYGNSSDLKQTILHVASRYGHTQIVQLIVENNQKCDANITTQRPDSSITLCSSLMTGNTALHWAVLNNHCDIVQLLLRMRNIDVNVRNTLGNTPLHWAACVVYLNYEADPTSKDSILSIFDHLVRAKADPFLTNNKGETVWDLLPKKIRVSFGRVFRLETKQREERPNVLFSDAKPRKRKDATTQATASAAASASAEDTPHTSRKRKEAPTQATAEAAASALMLLSHPTLGKKFRHQP